MKMKAVPLLAALAAFSVPALATSPVLPDVVGQDAGQLQAAMTERRLSSAAIVQAYLDRIRLVDDSGPTLNAVLALLPDALDQARKLDAERAAGKVRGPLHGIPVLIKDNVEAAGPVPTTAGSAALAANVTGRDAPLVAKLREAGAVILGKTNLSEWANIRSFDSSSGWSTLGGQTRNPHDLSRSPCGSSSGSGSAVAASLAPIAIGTETDGSIVCPAGINGIVGFKPSVGMVSRRHVVPISHSQDTAGPMTLTVRDAALTFAAMAGPDAQDSATTAAPTLPKNILAALRPDALKGKRVGVLMDRIGPRPDIAALLEAALATMTTEGAEVVRISDSRSGLEGMGEAEFAVLLAELKSDMGEYLKSLPAENMPRSLADLIAFNIAHPSAMKWFGQDVFLSAEATTGTSGDAYREARAKSLRLAGAEGIDKLLAAHKVDVLIGVSNGPAWTIDLVNGDHFVPPSASAMPAIAGYPHLTVPMGAVHGLPIGLSIIGPRWSDVQVLAIGNAYEQASRKRVVPTYRPAVLP